MGALLGAVAAALLAGTGLAVGLALALRGWPRLLLGAYVIAFAEVVVLTLVLSAVGAVTRTALLAGLAVLFVAAIGGALSQGALRLPPLELRPLARPPQLLMLAGVVGLALAYIVALVVGTAPNSWDSLVYHLARAAFWRQDGAVGYIDKPFDDRLNANPPNAEVALTFVLELTRDERFTGFVQVFAALACAIAVVALARRLGLARREAAFGGLLFVTLPVVVLQAATTQNDLVLASLLLAATVFVVGESRGALGLTALAIALAMGTKVTALFALPILCAAAVVAQPRTARGGRIAAVAIGALAGSYWYGVNLAETGRLLGERPDTELLAVGDLRENFLAGFARILDAFDLSGAESTDRFVVRGFLDSDLLAYLLVAIALAVCLLAVALLTRKLNASVGLVAGGLALFPLLVPPTSYALWRIFAKIHDVLGGTTGALPAGEWPPQTTASESLSWFGPLGLVLVVANALASVVLLRRRVATALAFVLATAPVVWLLLFSLSIGYDIWQGRFFVYPVALSAALWGLLLRSPGVAWAAVAVGATTVALSLVNSLEKPSGVRLFADRSIESIWGMERWQVQSLPRPETATVLRFLEEEVPVDASIALALSENDFGYPPFGPHLEREVELAPLEGSVPEVDAAWLLASPERAPQVDASCWREEVRSRGGSVFSRRPGCVLQSSGG